MNDKVEYVAPEDLEKYIKENSTPFISDANILATLKKLKLPENLPFEERMRIDSEDPEDVVVKDVEDDKERELALYYSFIFFNYFPLSSHFCCVGSIFHSFIYMLTFWLSSLSFILI